MPTRCLDLRLQRGRHRRRRPPAQVGAALTAAALAAGTITGLGVGRAAEQTAAAAPAGAVSASRALVRTGDELDVALWERASAAARLEARQRTAAVAERVAEQARASRSRAERLRPREVLPVAGYHLTAGFEERGGLWSSGAHTGLDFAAPTGTPVHAVTDGDIIETSTDGAYGNRIVLRSADGTVSYYAHLSRFVRRSGHVLAGETIGRVGSTGNTTGPHLHLEIRPAGGAPVDPRDWLRAHGLRP